MPCEACNAQFTVFKRKKSCTECRRFYCGNCLMKTKERILCERCVIFTTRPLTKMILLNLKAKDLIFYLQSKHISTKGCVEKEELVNLVLIHVNNANTYSPDSHSSTRSFGGGGGGGGGDNDENRSNPFDQIKNTCQNLFTTFTEKIAADLNFDLKPTASGQQQQQTQQQQQNVHANQPRRTSNVRFQSPYFNNSTVTSTTTNTTTNQRQNSFNDDHIGNMQVQPITTTTTTTQTLSPNGANQTNFSNPIQIDLQSPTYFSSSVSTTPSAPPYDSDATIEDLDDLKPSSHRYTATNTRDRNHTEQATNSQQKSSNFPSASGTRSDINAGKKLRDNKRGVKHLFDNCVDNSGCECSDEELFTKFKRNYKSELFKKSMDDNDEEQKAGPSASITIKTPSNPNTPNKEEISFLGGGSSDVSSFEDLGAVSINNVSKRASAASCDTDNWQIINQPVNDEASNVLIPPTIATTSSSLATTRQHLTTTLLPNTVIESSYQCSSQTMIPTFQTHSTNEIDSLADLEKSSTNRSSNRKISRRRSDGIVYMASSSSTARHLYDLPPKRNDDDDGDDAEDNTNDEGDQLRETVRKRTKRSCHRCGKRKGNLKKHIARFRRDLETTTNSTEAEIRQQLCAFLKFLEAHSKSSFDTSDDTDTDAEVEVESHTHPSDCNADNNSYQSEIVITAPDDDDDFDDDAGINVYGVNDESLSTQSPRKFFNLNEIESSEELEELSVKQLKEVLMLNRIDFKGCCEKTELLERVQRLWNDLQNCPSIDKLPTVDLCKICMDAAIECVLLECGHMATCTNCGKVLSECPICRQYIVRVVRFFKA